MGLAWLDLSTGAFSLAPSAEATLAADLARIMPGEILVPERLLARPALFELFGEWKAALTPLANPRFDSEAARRRLEQFYGVKALDGFGQFSRAEIAAAGALVDYVALTQQPGEAGGALHLAAAGAARARHGDADRRRDAAQSGADAQLCRASAAAACSP